jgi:hypothetical protein
MTDFSAFPSRKSTIQPWQIGFGVIGLTTVFFTIAGLIELYMGDGIGMAMMLVVVLIVVAVVSIASLITLAVFVVKFIFGVILPRIKNLAMNEPIASRQIDDVPILRQFANDNNFEFIEYDPETAAPAESYGGVIKKQEDDDVYIMYQINGKSGDVSFTYYCLGFASAGGPQYNGFGYAFTSDGRRLNYITVLTTDHPIRPWYKGTINATNSPNGYVFTDGRVIDRETIVRMFAMLES